MPPGFSSKHHSSQTAGQEATICRAGVVMRSRPTLRFRQYFSLHPGAQNSALLDAVLNNFSTTWQNFAVYGLNQRWKHLLSFLLDTFFKELLWPVFQAIKNTLSKFQWKRPMPSLKWHTFEFHGEIFSNFQILILRRCVIAWTKGLWCARHIHSVIHG